MDLQTAVGVSMLGFSRTRVSAVFKELRQRDPHTSLVTLLDALGAPPRTNEDWRRRHDRQPPQRSRPAPPRGWRPLRGSIPDTPRC